MVAVEAKRETLVIPTAPEKNPLFFEKRVYQGSCGKVHPVPFIDKVLLDETFDLSPENPRHRPAFKCGVADFQTLEISVKGYVSYRPVNTEELERNREVATEFVSKKNTRPRRSHAKDGVINDIVCCRNTKRAGGSLNCSTGSCG